MNRRRLLSLIAGTALTPIIPPQVFVSGGPVKPNPLYLVGERGPEFLIPRGKHIGIAMNSAPKGGIVNVMVDGRAIITYA